MTPGEIPVIDREKTLLGCLLIAPQRASECASLSPEWFTAKHQPLFRAIVDLAESREAINPASVAHKAQSSGHWVDLNYLVDLSQITGPDAPLRLYVQEITEANALREVKAWIDAGVGYVEFVEKFDAIKQTVGAPAAPRGLPAIVNAFNLVDSKMEQPAELVAGLLHRGSKIVLGGSSKSFKTWNLLDLGISVAHGEPWMNYATVQGPVLYLNFEIPEWAIRKRIYAVADAKGITLAPNCGLHVWNLRGYSTDYGTILPIISRHVQEAGYVLVILDPIYKLYGRADENKANDVAQLLNAIERLGIQTKAATAFGAHFAKGDASGKEAMDRISGSGVFSRDPDSILVFTKHEQDKAFAVEAILRNFPPVAPFVVRWEYPLFRRDEALDPSRLKKAGRSKDHDAGQVLALLQDGSLTTTEWQSQATEEHGMSARTFYRLKDELVRQKRVIKSKVNDKWQAVTAKTAKTAKSLLAPAQLPTATTLGGSGSSCGSKAEGEAA